MIFKNIGELSHAIDTAVGLDFIQKFLYRYRDLKGLSQRPPLNLLGNIHDEDAWAINKGGGTEIQYQISYHSNTLFYGLGFNTQTVPFKYEKSEVDFARPFMEAFLAEEGRITKMLPDYGFVVGSRNNLISPQPKQFTLFGKKFPLTDLGTAMELADSDFDVLAEDLKRQFPAYELIYITKNERFNSMEQISAYTNLLTKIKPQIILQGAPGTGKTYTAEAIAYQLIFGEPMSKDKVTRASQLKALEDSGQYGFVQFHPAYTYEDFIRGISAKAEGPVMDYKAANRKFAKFAATAQQNLADSGKAAAELSREEWVGNQLESFLAHLEEETAKKGKVPLTEAAYIWRQNENTIRYKGDNWSIDGGVPFADLKEMYLSGVKNLQEVRDLKSLSLSAKGNSTYWLKMVELFQSFIKDSGAKPPSKGEATVNRKTFVFVIDEINRANLPAVLGELIYALEYRDRGVDSIYELEEGENKITIPSNLYLIGTMNTADRSVGHIDYAIRRRFAFANVNPDVTVITNPKAALLFRTVKKLFIAENAGDAVYKSSEFEANDVMLGHSYFLAEDDEALALKLRYEILPILKEYVRDGILSELPGSFEQNCNDALI